MIEETVKINTDVKRSFVPLAAQYKRSVSNYLTEKETEGTKNLEKNRSIRTSICLIRFASNKVDFEKNMPSNTTEFCASIGTKIR